MKDNLRFIFIIFLLFSNTLIFAQNAMQLNGGVVKQKDGYIVLKNTKWVNNANFSQSEGKVLITGDALGDEATIGGSASSTFNKLVIDKSANNALLENDILIFDTLILENGSLDLQAHTLTASVLTTIVGVDTNQYIKTSSSGSLKQDILFGEKLFPIGDSNYTPVTITNNGIPNQFYARVSDEVMSDNFSLITTDIVGCAWSINPENPDDSIDVDLEFQWNIDDELTNFDRTNSFVAYLEIDTALTWNFYETQSASGNNPYTITRNNVTSLTQFAIGSSSSIFSQSIVFPVEMLSFYGRKEGENTRLFWETATEINNDFFEVEWSKHGNSFEKIGQVQGAGSTTELQAYQFLHSNPSEGLNYYRLKQVDFDGRYEYSKIQSVSFQDKDNSKTRVFPNPSAAFFYIDVSYEVFVVALYNQLGQQVLLVENTRNLDVSKLPAGTYFMKIQDQESTAFETLDVVIAK